MSHIANGLNGASGTWSRDAVSSLAPAESRTRVDKTIEIIAIVVLGVATIGVAWCGYQSMQWTAASSQHAETASQKHIAAAALFGLATQKISYDGAISAQYAKAVSDGKSGVADFYRDALVRKDMLPILDAWQADLEAGRTPTPLGDDTDYLASQLADCQAAIAAAANEARLGKEAGSIASHYVAVTILFAVAVFLSGMISRFRYRLPRILLLAATLATFMLAASRLASLPVQF